MRYKENKPTTDLHALFQKAASHFQRGQLENAKTFARKILDKYPEQADTHHLLGLIAGQQGQHEQAAQYIAIAIRITPDNPSYHLNHALALLNCKRLNSALVACDHAIRINPAIPEAHFRRANLLRDLGQREEAVSAYEHAIRLRPAYVEAHYNLGNVFRLLGQSTRALSCYRSTVSLKPDFAEAHNNLGAVLQDLGNPTEALAAHERAAELKPNYAEAHSNCGMALIQLDRRADALAAFDRAIALKPDFAEAHNNRGLVLKAMGHLEAACESHRTALDLRPDYDQAHDNLLFTLNYRPDLSPEQLFKAHSEWDHQHASALLPKPLDFGDQNSDQKRRLRIGYVSPDFRTHSVAWFFEPLLSAHHNDAVEVFCYSNVLHPDETTTRIRSKADHWRSIASLSDKAAAEKIRQDRIDILVDLAGHTANHRLLVFARKPAPIQVTWLGYPNTTGLQTMDYRLTDAAADPEGEADQMHSEKLIRLAQGFLCYSPPQPAPPISETPAIKTGHITFGSFNNLAKINAKVIQAWAGILHVVPGSRLLLKDKALADDITREQYLKQFKAHGIGRERVELHGKQISIEDHLATYCRIDIGLDPFSYNGTTTTCEALWMGVPVVTLAGDRHAGRVGTSILEYAGYPGWIASDPASYVKIAAHLAGDTAELNTIRQTLRTHLGNSSLCDSDTFARTVEDAYRLMWKNYSEARR